MSLIICFCASVCTSMSVCVRTCLWACLCVCVCAGAGRCDGVDECLPQCLLQAGQGVPVLHGVPRPSLPGGTGGRRPAARRHWPQVSGSDLTEVQYMNIKQYFPSLHWFERKWLAYIVDTPTSQCLHQSKALRFVRSGEWGVSTSGERYCIRDIIVMQPFVMNVSNSRPWGPQLLLVVIPPLPFNW